MTRKEAEEIAAAEWKSGHVDALEKNWERLVDKARKERDEARAEVARLREALTEARSSLEDANNYNCRCERNLKLSDPCPRCDREIEATKAIDAALSPAPVQKCEWSEHGRTCDRPATRIDLARGDPPYACEEHAGVLHQPLSPTPSEPKCGAWYGPSPSACVLPASHAGRCKPAPSESERSGR